MSDKTFEELQKSIDEKVSGINSAVAILSESIKCLGDRAVTYDSPGGERSMDKTVRAFNEMHGTSLTEVQGWQFMELLKMARSTQGAFKSDNFVDGAAYAALACEAASKKYMLLSEDDKESIPDCIVCCAKQYQWANCIAVDDDGSVYAYANKPDIDECVWLTSEGASIQVGIWKECPNWKESLIEIKRG